MFIESFKHGCKNFIVLFQIFFALQLNSKTLPWFSTDSQMILISLSSQIFFTKESPMPKPPWSVLNLAYLSKICLRFGFEIPQPVSAILKKPVFNSIEISPPFLLYLIALLKRLSMSLEIWFLEAKILAWCKLSFRLIFFAQKIF